jgi:hypothetical protein
LLGGFAALVFIATADCSPAFASPGCDAVNGGAFTASATAVPGKTGTEITIANFAVGDTVTFNIVIVPGSGNPQWHLGAGSNDLNLLAAVASSTQTYTVTGNLVGGQADTTLSQLVFINLDPGSVNATATCTPARSSSNKSDSQSLRALQVDVTKVVAASSGAAITGAVDGAIGDAFSSTGGAPITVGPNGFTMNFAADSQSNVARRTDEAFSALGSRGNIYNFAAEPQSQIASRTNDAFSALGYAGNVTKAPPRIYDREWSAWADVRGTGFDQNNALSDTHGTQLNVTGGVGRKLTPDFLVGLFTGYEHFNFTVESLNGKMSGDGGTVGAYGAYRFARNWRADATIGRSEVWYNGTAGTASGSFTGSRWLASGGVTGDYQWAVFLLEPSTRIYTLWESENAWTDSLGTLQPSRSFSESRVSTGGKVIYPWQTTGAIQISPYAGVYGDYRFSSDNALPVGVPFVGIKDGWSARTTAGVTFATNRGGPSVSVGGELGGIGAGYDIWSANARVNWPF